MVEFGSRVRGDQILNNSSSNSRKMGSTLERKCSVRRSSRYDTLKVRSNVASASRYGAVRSSLCNYTRTRISAVLLHIVTLPSRDVVGARACKSHDHSAQPPFLNYSVKKASQHSSKMVKQRYIHLLGKLD